MPAMTLATRSCPLIDTNETSVESDLSFQKCEQLHDEIRRILPALPDALTAIFTGFHASELGGLR
jgi:hypothetical protein